MELYTLLIFALHSSLTLILLHDIFLDTPPNGINSPAKPTKYENWKKGEEKFNKRFEPLKDSD